MRSRFSGFETAELGLQRSVLLPLIDVWRCSAGNQADRCSNTKGRDSFIWRTTIDL